MPTGHPGLLMATPRTADLALVARAIEDIAAFCRHGDVEAALAVLRTQVPEFEHSSAGVQPSVLLAGAP